MEVSINPELASLRSETLTYDPRPEYPLVVTANRYWDPAPYRPGGYTLILTHGTGFHKEQWEPTLKHLFSMSKSSHEFPIREAWSLDCPNHGDAAILNEKALLRGGYDLVFPWAEYTHVLYLFLTQNKDIPFRERNIIAIGHSMGAVSLALTQTYPNRPRFTQLVLCDPMLGPADVPNGDPNFRVGDAMIATAQRRRDVWPSRKAALEAFKSRKGFAIWDDEVLKNYAKYGLRDLPTGSHSGTEGVTLKCTKRQEIACYRDIMSARRLFDFLPILCSRISVHVIWGAIDDSLHGEVKKLVTDAKSGRKVASVSHVEGAGHLVVQMAPKKLANAILSAVTQVAKESIRSRL